MTNNSQPTLGTLQCIMILVGGMVGSAIFSLSGVTYMTAGPATILSWVIGGIILLLYGLQTAELCTIYPRSGGIFVFPYEALAQKEAGKAAWGWASAWSYLNVCIFGAAFSATYIAQYLGIAFPFFSNIVLWAVIWMVLCGVLCLFNVAVAGTVNLVLVCGLIVTMLIYAFAGFGSFNIENFAPFFTQGTGGAFGFVGQIPVAMLAFGAIVAIAFMVSQVKNPKKTVPQSMIISMIITIILYVLVLVGTIGMLAAQFFVENPGMAYVPLYAAAWNVLYNLPWLPAVISIAATLALTTTMLVLMMNAGWTVQAAAEYGMLPKALGKINPKTGTPINALITCTVIALVFCLTPDFTGMLINTGAIANALCVVAIALSLLYARKQHAYVPGEFRLGGGKLWPIVTIILVLFFIIPGVFQSWDYWLYYIIWMAVGFAVMLIYRAIAKNKEKGASISE